MKKRDGSPTLSRRDLVAAAPAAGLAGVAMAATGGRAQAAAPPPRPDDHRHLNFEDTEHVRQAYQRMRM